MENRRARRAEKQPAKQTPDTSPLPAPVPTITSPEQSNISKEQQEDASKLRKRLDKSLGGWDFGSNTEGLADLYNRPVRTKEEILQELLKEHAKEHEITIANPEPRAKRKSGLVKEFFRGFGSSVGLGKDIVPWSHAIGLGIVIGVIYWLAAYASLHLIINDYASFWAPNGAFIGGLIRASPRGRRMIILCVIFAIFTVNLAFGNNALMSFYFVILNCLDSLIVASICLGLVRALYPGKISILRKAHFVCLGVGIILGCGITSNFGTNFARWKLNPPHEAYGLTFLGYFGRNLAGDCLVAPVILTFPIHKSVMQVVASWRSTFRRVSVVSSIGSIRHISRCSSRSSQM